MSACPYLPFLTRMPKRMPDTDRTCSNAFRTTSEEKRYDLQMAMEDPEVTYKNIRRAAEVHRQVRKYARKFIRPGMRMIDIADGIENGVRALVEEDGSILELGSPQDSASTTAQRITPPTPEIHQVSVSCASTYSGSSRPAVVPWKHDP